MLKQLRLNKQLEIAQKRKQEFFEKKNSYLLRSEELGKAIEEAQSEEDLLLIDENAKNLENDVAGVDAHIQKVDEEISNIQKELEEIESKSPDNQTPPSEPQQRKQEVYTLRETRAKSIGNPFKQTAEQRSAYLARQDVKDFYERVLNLSREKRAVNNSELGIPEIMMGLIRDSIDDYSAILRAVTMRTLRGEGKAIIAGKIPEAVWTECCANINELDIDFSDMYIYCHKVSGYIPVCNATIEDFQIQGISSLAAEIEYNLLKAIGYALDKAIIYGDGIHMPLGFVSSLPMTANPINPTQTWTSYSSNVKGITGEGVELYQNILKAISKAKRHTARGRKVFIMNETTWESILAPESLEVNSAGTIVAATNESFPIVGGQIIFLDFIPDGDIVGGYLENYLLVERMGIQMAMSEHLFFLQDNTVFKATARYDGTPIVPYRDSFFAININGGTPKTTMTFAPDTAN